VRLCGEPVEQGPGGARLADAGLAREQHDAAAAALRLLPAAHEGVELLAAPDERRGLRPAQRLVAAGDRALAQHQAGIGGTCVAELAALEQPPHEVPRRPRYGHAARRREAGEPGGEQRRLADERGLRRGRAGDAVVDHDHAGGDADARLDPPLEAGNGEPSYGARGGEAGPHRPLGVVLVRQRMSEAGDHPIRQMPRNAAAVALHDRRDAGVAGGDGIAQVLGVEACREGRETRDAAGHDGGLPALPARRAPRWRRARLLRRGRPGGGDAGRRRSFRRAGQC
jgi:hypothetical protein